MPEKSNKYKLLSNFPCGEDKFEGHSHQHIANQIANVLRNDQSCRIVGIEGGWGTGKSNLVQLIKKNLESNSQDKKFKFFTYDAWGHITDLQKRSILEELTESLKEDLQPAEKWEIKRTNLLSKSRTTRVRDIPNLNGFLAMIIFIILFHPVINDIITSIPSTWQNNGLSTIIELLIYAFLLCIGFQWNNDQKRYDLGNKDKSFHFEDLFALYTKKVQSTTTFEQIQENEPTSQEFKDWIKSIDNDLPNNEIVVLVFDNMDRLPQEKVQEFWAAIHSFFSTDAETNYSKIKVIIPFDRSHVREAFKRKGESESYGDDFINKTFNIVYRVSPIIMTAWKSYLSELWKEAFNEELSSEVTQIYDALATNKTPRDIIAFVNKCVTIKEICEDIPDKYIALFIFGFNDISKNPTEAILHPKFTGSLSFLYENDKELPKYLSALYYQLPVEKAVDIVLASQLVRDLDNGKVESYKATNSNQEFIIQLLEKALPQVTNIENTVKAFKEIGLDESQHKESLWNCICEVALKNDKISDYKDYQKDIFEHIVEKTQYFWILINGYRGNIDNIGFKRYKFAIDELEKVDTSDVVWNNLIEHSVDIAPEKFIDYLSVCKEEFNCYGYNCETPKLDEYLGNVKIDNIENIPDIRLILNDKEHPDKELPKYISNLEKMVSLYIGDRDSLKILYDRIKELFRPMPERFLLDDDDLGNLFRSSNKDNDLYYDLIAMRIAKLDNYKPNYQNQSAFNNILNSIEKDDINGLSDVIEYYIDYNDLLNNYSKVRFPLVKAVIKELTNNSHGVSRLNLTLTIENFDDIIKETGLERAELFKRLNDWSNYYKDLKLEDFSIDLFKTAMDSTLPLAKSIENNIEIIYENTSQDEWKDSILSNGKLFKFWMLYHPQNIQNCFDALKEILKGLANGDEDMAIQKDTAQELIGIFKNLGNDIEYFMDEIYDILKSRDTKNRLLYFGEWLLTYCSNDKLSNFLRDLVPTDIIDKTVAEWLMSHKNAIRGRKPTGFLEKLDQLYKTEMSDNAILGDYLLSVKPKKNKKDK